MLVPDLITDIGGQVQFGHDARGDAPAGAHPQVFHQAGISLDDRVVNLGDQQDINQKKDQHSEY